MTDLTEDELRALDVERAKAAHDAEWPSLPFSPSDSITKALIEAARLGRTLGNTRPVDPGVLMARRLAASEAPPERKAAILAGDFDQADWLQAVAVELRIIAEEKGWKL